MIVLGVSVGGSIGTVVALKIQMTALPQLVAFFIPWSSLASGFVAAAAFFAPEAYESIGIRGNIATASLIEMALGTAIGAITFSGSIIAFSKLQGIMSGSPIVFPGQHALNALIGLAIVALIVLACDVNSDQAFWAIVTISLLIGFLLIIPIGGADMPVVVSMLNSYWVEGSWNWLGLPGTLHQPAGSSGAILSYIMCKGTGPSLMFWLSVLRRDRCSRNRSSRRPSRKIGFWR